MSKLLIASPSKNRLNFTIHKVLGNAVQMFVEPQDMELYAPITQELGLKQISVHKNDMGFGYALDSIIKYCVKNNLRYVLFADDDIFGLKTRGGVKVVDYDLFFSEGLSLLKKRDYAQLMISFSGHNWYTKERIKEHVGCWGMIFMDVEKIQNAGGYDTDLRIFNDWDISARLVRKGYTTACWYDYQFEHKMKSKKGGAFDLYEDNKFMLEQCKKMQAKHGHTVTIGYHKKHEQYEIRFDWGKVKSLKGTPLNKKGLSKFI